MRHLLNPLTLICCVNTIVAFISKSWPPLQQDKAVTVIFPWLIWMAYTAVEWDHRRKIRSHRNE